MKIIKRRVIPVLMAVILTITLCIPALAVDYSTYDLNLLTQEQLRQVAAAKAAYEAAEAAKAAATSAAAAKAAADQMAAAHAAAEAVRAQAASGGYSGGAYGADYNALYAAQAAAAQAAAAQAAQAAAEQAAYYASLTSTINASAGTGGSISPSGSATVSYGGTQSYTITPNAGFFISDVIVDGTSVGAVSNYTFGNVTASHTISASFVPNTYSINASAGIGGSIGPSGTATVAYGGTQTYTITPNEGYNIASVVVDGTSIGAVSSFTFTNVTAAHTISASFVLKTFSINASAGTGGSISPNGTATVNYGTNKIYTITPNSGYKISGVKVDGTSVGAISNHTFNNITGAHTISATFASNASLSAGIVTLGDGGSGTLKAGNVTRSGYGITASLPVATSYVSGTTVTANYRFTTAEGIKSVSLVYVGSTWQFPVNSTSSTSARKIYIPVATKDGTYTITFAIKALDPQATLIAGTNVYLTDAVSTTVTISGSMYDDAATGDS